MNKKRIAAAVLVLTAVGAGIWWALRDRPVASDTLVLYGNVDVRQVALAFNASERIGKLLVQEGEHVRAGQLLGELDTRALALQLAQAQAQTRVREQALQRLQAGSRPEEVAQARATVAAAQADAGLAHEQLARLQAVHQSTAGRAVSRQDVDNAAARDQVAQAQLDSARTAQQLVVSGPRSEDIAQAKAQLEAARAEAALLQHQLGEAQLKA
ncbi:MAG TPA: biotin/lipoyl-binding protein, partial [Telluria sp.]|nr:biotin/lipoyl-binding protein [Telluria sp.]